MTARQLRFAQIIASGETNAHAYRTVYKPNANDKTAAQCGCRMAKHPSVVAEIARMRGKSEAKKLLTLNDRLGILANIAQARTASKTERIRAIEVYSKISGDQAPERHEVSGPGGTPIQEEVTHRKLTVREKIERLEAARRQREEPAP